MWKAIEKHRITGLSITGDAMARPLVEALEEGGYDASSLVTIASTAAVFSAVVKDKFLELLPNLIIAEAVGSTETGYNGATVIVKGTKTKPGMPTVRMGPDTVVLDDDYNIVEPDRVVGKMARGGNVPLRYHKDPEKSAATFVDVGGRRCGLRRLRDRRSRRFDDIARPRFGVHQLRRREDLPGRGRGRAQGASGGVRRGCGRCARRPVGRARRRGRGTA